MEEYKRELEAQIKLKEGQTKQVPEATERVHTAQTAGQQVIAHALPGQEPDGQLPQAYNQRGRTDITSEKPTESDGEMQKRMAYQEELRQQMEQQKRKKEEEKMKLKMEDEKLERELDQQRQKLFDKERNELVKEGRQDIAADKPKKAIDNRQFMTSEELAEENKRLAAQQAQPVQQIQEPPQQQQDPEPPVYKPFQIPKNPSI